MSSVAGTTAPPGRHRSRIALLLLAGELLLCVVAVLALSAWTAVRLSGRFATSRELAEFAEAKRAGGLPTTRPDQRLWSPERVIAWKQSLTRDEPPLAVLRIRGLGIEAPVLEGTDDWALNRGVGHIADTATPGAKGNCGLAGHRDGFFRALKDVKRGDAIEIETQRGVATYKVERVWIVAPEDVSVLDPTTSHSLTLVTCYPFYFIGSAPQRFIVRAVDSSVD
jgi:sortase A